MPRFVLIVVMKLLLLFAAVIGVSFSATLDDLWGQWKSKYAKVYDDEATESVRRLVWESNWQFVQQHNSEGHSYEVEMNEFADLVSRGSCFTSGACPDCLLGLLIECHLTVDRPILVVTVVGQSRGHVIGWKP